MKINLADLNITEVHDVMGRVIIPRPIAWVSTVGPDGINNAAPFSVFTGAVCVKPPMLCFAVIPRPPEEPKKDTLRNIEFSGDFVVNLVDESLAEAMHQTAESYPSDVDEIQEVGLTTIKSDLVKAPRITEAPVSLECRLSLILQLGQPPMITSVVFGEVLLIHARDELCVGIEIQPDRLLPIARLAGDLWCRSRDTFVTKIPKLADWKWGELEKR